MVAGEPDDHQEDLGVYLLLVQKITAVRTEDLLAIIDPQINVAEVGRQRREGKRRVRMRRRVWTGTLPRKELPVIMPKLFLALIP